MEDKTRIIAQSTTAMLKLQRKHISCNKTTKAAISFHLRDYASHLCTGHLLWLVDQSWYMQHNTKRVG